MKTRRELTIRWGPGHTPHSVYTTKVPKGHPVDRIHGALFVRYHGLGLNQMQQHDAIHYGIRIEQQEVED